MTTEPSSRGHAGSRTRFFFFPILLAAFAIIAPRSAESRTWYIKPDGTGDAPTIADAVFESRSGDTVLLAPGRFTGPGNFGISEFAHSLVVTSEAGPESTIIDCQGFGRGFTVQLNRDDIPVTISGITVENGDASNEWISQDGGGIWCYRNVTVTNCILRGNLAQRGGGIACHGTATISNNTIAGNSAQDRGGGMYFWGDVTITGNTVTGNNAQVAAGGIVGGGLTDTPGSATVSHNLIQGNTAFHEAGGMRCGSDAVFTDNVVSGNTAWAGGGVVCGYKAIFTNNLVYGNSAQTRGGGILCDDGLSKILGNTVCGNSAPQGAGIAFERDGDYADVERTIIAFNTQGPAFECFDGIMPPMVLCCNIFGNEGGNAICAGEQRDNFSLDPQFCGVLGSGNYNLQSDSPCAPNNHPSGENCGLIGARPVTCGTVETRPGTWGWLKSQFGGETKNER